MSRYFDSSTTTQMAEIIVQYRRPSIFLRGICMVIFWQDCYGKGKLKISYWSTAGKKFTIGDTYSYIAKKNYSYLCMWMKSNWLERKKYWPNAENTRQRSWFHLLDHVYLRCTQRQWEVSKDIFDNDRTMFESRICAGAIENFSMLEQPDYLFDFSWHGKSCQGMCGQSKRLNNCTKYPLHSLMTINFQRRRIEICKRIVKRFISNWLEMRELCENWKTRYSMFIEQTCTVDYKMDQNLWQTPESVDIFHSSHM